MMENLRSVRPAGAAIAAVLAFGATSSLAQEASTPVAPVVQVPAPEISAPAPTSGTAAPSFTPSQPMVQPTQSVEERLNASIAASEAATTEARSAPARQPRAQSTATKPAAQPRAEARQVTPSAPEVAQIQAPAPTPPASVAKTAPAAAEAPLAAPVVPATEQATPDPALLAALGGGALLLAGIAGVALSRRRRSQRDEIVEPTAYSAPLPEREPTPEMRPIAASAAAAPVIRPAPAPAMSHLPADERLHAMVAAPPSPENPFRTHKKRMTRAKFLLAQQERGSQRANVPQETAASPVKQQEQVQAVYRFGSDRGKSPSFRPRTN